MFSTEFLSRTATAGWRTGIHPEPVLPGMDSVSRKAAPARWHSGRLSSFQVRQLLAACQSDLHDKALIDLRRRKFCEALDTEFSRSLEGKTHGKLQAASGVGTNRLV